MYKSSSNNSPFLYGVPFDYFAEKLRDAYFKGKADIDSSEGSYVRSNFNNLKNLILQYPETRRKRDLTKKIMSYFSKHPITNEYYQTINGEKQDLKTLAFEVGANYLGIFLIKKEKEIKESAERSRRNCMARWGEKDDDDDYGIPEQTNEPEIKVLDDIPTFMLMMYGTKGTSFAYRNPKTDETDLAAQLIDEFNIDPHKVVSIKMHKWYSEDRYAQTTPFIYFLERHNTWGDRENRPHLKVPPTTDNDFYKTVDLDFVSFSKRQIYMSFLMAGLAIHAGKFATDHVQQTRAKWFAEHGQPEEPVEQTEEVPNFELEQEIIQEDTPVAKKDTRKKPRIVAHHKDDDTQNLPGFENERS